MAAEEKKVKLSRIGKLPVSLPKGVEVKIDGLKVTVKGPKGELERTLPPEVSIEQGEGTLNIAAPGSTRRARAMHGLSRSLVQNMVEGVSKGYERVLEVIGVGYRAELKGQRYLLFTLGYSHPLLYELPEGISAEVTRDNKVKISGIDKEKLGLVAAKIRSFRKPEPYKGKGIKYAEEVIQRKAGKAAAR